jgi:hypothetical protein
VPQQFQAPLFRGPIPVAPLVTVPLGAKMLKVTPKAVDLMLLQLGGALPREVTGRRKYRAWGIV